MIILWDLFGLYILPCASGFSLQILWMLPTCISLITSILILFITLLIICDFICIFSPCILVSFLSFVYNSGINKPFHWTLYHWLLYICRKCYNEMLRIYMILIQVKYELHGLCIDHYILALEFTQKQIGRMASYSFFMKSFAIAIYVGCLLANSISPSGHIIYAVLAIFGAWVADSYYLSWEYYFPFSNKFLT